MPNYTLRNIIQNLNAGEQLIVVTHPPVVKEQWSEARYEPIKQRIKHDLMLGQHDRCAYCRKIIEADGKYEPLEHIVAKSLKPVWMFEPKNLIVTCDSCNNLKGTDETLTAAYTNSAVLPVISDAYIIFNPHYDVWDEHLRYEDDIFLVAVPDSKGEDTIRICKLFRYNVIVNKAKELKLQQKVPARRALQRLKKMDKDSQEYAQLSTELINAMDHYLERLNDNPDFD